MATKTTDTDGKTYQSNHKEYTDIIVAVSNVKVDYSWNTRKKVTYTGQDFDAKAAADLAPSNPLAAAKAAGSIGELAKLIKNDGLMNRPLARDMGDGKFFLVAGFRRWMAMTDEKEGGLGWKEVPLRVKRMTDSEAVRINLEENQARKELTTPEIADGVHRYREALKAEGIEPSKGKTEGYGTKIAAEMQMSKSAVNLYLNIMDNVHPKIIAVWMDVGNPSQTMLSLNRLSQWAKMPKDAQLKRFRNLEKTGNEETEGAEAVDNSDGVEGSNNAAGEGNGQTAPALRMVKYDQAAEALAYFKEEIKSVDNPATKQWMTGAIAALQWSMNKIKKEHKGKLRLGDLGEYNPWADDDAEEAEKASEKAQEAALKEAEKAAAAAAKNGNGGGKDATSAKA